MKLKQRIRLLRLWYYSRKQIIDEVQSLTEMLDIQMSKYINKIEALDQSKIYIIYDEYADRESTQALYELLKRYQNKLKWTLPKIITLNRPFKPLTKQELKIIAKEIRGNHVQTHNKS